MNTLKNIIFNIMYAIGYGTAYLYYHVKKNTHNPSIGISPSGNKSGVESVL